MKNGTWLGELKDKIMTKEPTTFSEVMSMAVKLIKLDEDRITHRMMIEYPLKEIKDLSSKDLELSVLTSEAWLYDLGKKPKVTQP